MTLKNCFGIFTPPKVSSGTRLPLRSSRSRPSVPALQSGASNTGPLMTQSRVAPSASERIAASSSRNQMPVAALARLFWLNCQCCGLQLV